MPHHVLLICLTLFLSACAGGMDDANVSTDSRDDAFLVDGKADRIWLTRDDMRRVFYTVNSSDITKLDDEIGIDRRAAEAIIEFRRGSDGLDFNEDDEWFSNLSTLDERPWVGPYAFERLVEHARSEESITVPELLAESSRCTEPQDGKLINGDCAVVEHVIDGDTLELRLDVYSTARLRLRGIDTPECHKARVDGRSSCVDSAQGERFGYEAYEMLHALVDGETVRIACEMVDGECRHDLYDRYLAWPVLERSYVDVAEVLVAGGYAWPYLPMIGLSTATYCAAEDAAIADGRGLWADGYDLAIAGMSPDKQRWYSRREWVCP